MPSPCTDLTVREALIVHELDPSMEELLRILALRLARTLGKENDAINMFLDVEGSQEYFGHRDGEHFDQVKEQHKIEKAELKS